MSSATEKKIRNTEGDRANTQNAVVVARTPTKLQRKQKENVCTATLKLLLQGRKHCIQSRDIAGTRGR